jgi:hypothetical protein
MAEVVDIEDVPAHRRREIEHFFRTYKELEVAKYVEIRQVRPPPPSWICPQNASSSVSTSERRNG